MQWEGLPSKEPDFVPNSAEHFCKSLWHIIKKENEEFLVEDSVNDVSPSWVDHDKSMALGKGASVD